MYMDVMSIKDFIALIPKRKRNLTKASEIRNVHFQRMNNFIVVVVIMNGLDGSEAMYSGVTKCDDRDLFNPEIGIKISANRAWNEICANKNNYGKDHPYRNDIYRIQGVKRITRILLKKKIIQLNPFDVVLSKIMKIHSMYGQGFGRLPWDSAKTITVKSKTKEIANAAEKPQDH
jgi:hypothetical protein